MIEPNKQSHSLPHRSLTSQDVLAIAAWLFIQVTALAIGALRVPLWARYPSPAEDCALEVMLVAQFAFASMLMPGLIRSVRAALAVVLAAIAFAQLASMLSGTDAPKTSIAVIQLLGWMLSIMLLAYAVERDAQRALLSALATAYALGGPLLLYLHETYAPSVPGTSPTRLALSGPIATTIARLHDNAAGVEASWLIWLSPVAVLSVSVVAAMWRWRERHSASISQGPG